MKKVNYETKLLLQLEKRVSVTRKVATQLYDLHNVLLTSLSTVEATLFDFEELKRTKGK